MKARSDTLCARAENAMEMRGTHGRGVATRAPHAHLTAVHRCIGRMEAVDFKQRMAADGVSFEFYNAGHVLGAAMVLLEIAGVRILYTGDYRSVAERFSWRLLVVRTAW